MSDETKLCVTKATALAAVNAVIKEAKLGLFVSDCLIKDHGSIYWRVEDGEKRTRTFVSVSGRADTGAPVWAAAIITYDNAAPENSFPIKPLVLVSVRKPRRTDAHHHEYDYYSCMMQAGGFTIQTLSQKELERLAET